MAEEITDNKAKELLIDKNHKASRILCNDKMSDDLKLFQIFEIYKADIEKEHKQLYYALLAWKDTHLKEIREEMTLINLVQEVFGK